MSWKKFRNTISNTLNSVDKFEEPVQLNIKGNDTSTSSLGGLISLAIMIFLGYQFIKQTVDMFQRNSQQVIQMNEFQNDPDSLYLNKEDDFTFGISSRIGGYFFNMSQGSSISFKATYYQNYNNGKNTSVSQILWAPCNRSDFKIFSDKEYEAYYLAYAYCAVSINYTDPSTGICPSNIQGNFPDCITPPSFRLQGTQFSQIYEYIELEITMCDPNDTATIYGLKCSPTAYNDTIVFGGINVHMGFTNIYVDPTNYDSPNQHFIDFIEYYLNPLKSRIANIFVDMETVEDYDHYLLSDVSKNQTFYSVSADKMREEEITPRNFLLRATIKRSKVNHITTRTYLNIFDVLSNVGGLSEPLFLIGGILVLGYARYKYFMIISNELYDFEKYEKTISVNKVAFKSMEKMMLDQNNNPNSPQSSVRASSNKPFKINIKGYFDALKTRKKLEYSEYSYLKGIMQTIFRKKNPNEQLAQKAKKKVYKDLDISKIVKKIKEIDKLKMLLLNESQIKAFNFIKQPQIILKDEKFKQKNSKKSLYPEESPEFLNGDLKVVAPKPERELSKYEKLYIAYKEIKEDKNSENSRLNQKLLSLIDEDIIRIFSEIDSHNPRTSVPHQFGQRLQEIQID